ILRIETLMSAAALRARIEAARLAVLVDLAAVILRALFLVAQNLIGGVDLLEFLYRRGVALMRIGVMFFGELAEGLFDFGLARLSRYAKNLIGIAHSLPKPGLAESVGLPFPPII